MTQPKPCAIIQQHLDGCAASIRKNKAMPAEWVKIKLATTNGSIAVDPFPEVDGLASQINFMCIGDGQHVRYALKNALNNSENRSVQIWIFISMPSGLYTSTTDVVVLNDSAGL